MKNFGYKKIFDFKTQIPNDKDLDSLALIMSGNTTFPDEGLFEFLKRTKKIAVHLAESDSNKIPAGYTYLGNFISHDISFDEASDRHVRNDRPWEIIKDPQVIKDLKNLRKPTFDLEAIYGYENPVNRGEPSRSDLMNKNSSLPLLKLYLTDKIGTVNRQYPHDLPRKPNSPLVDIVDSRNDENLLLAQTQVAFMKFHNALVVKFNESGNYTYRELFDKARRAAIRYYQTIILKDFLPRFIDADIILEILSKVGTKELFYQPTLDEMFIPLEFSVAAFRFGHSMIRNTYNINRIQQTAGLDNILMFTGRGKMNDPPFPQNFLPGSWIINWYSFYELNGTPANIAEPIDTNLSGGLQRLRPGATKGNEDGRANSLSALDLYRGRRFGLLTGQEISIKMFKTESITPEDICGLIERKEFTVPKPSEDEARQIKERLCAAFKDKTPLWFYILAEAEIRNDGKLGKVGSRITAETILQLLYLSEYSIINPNWTWEEGEDFLLEENNTFDMVKMLRFIEKMNRDHRDILYPDLAYAFDELNPLG